MGKPAFTRTAEAETGLGGRGGTASLPLAKAGAPGSHLLRTAGAKLSKSWKSGLTLEHTPVAKYWLPHCCAHRGPHVFRNTETKTEHGHRQTPLRL